MIGDTLSRLGRQTAVYSFGDLLVKSMTFLLIPVLTRVWDARGPEMGVYGLLHLAEAVSYLFFNMGLALAVIKVLADYRHGRSRGAVVFSTLGLLATLSLGMLVAAWAAAGPLAAALFRGTLPAAEGTLLLRLTLLATYLSTYRFVTLSLLRVENRPWHYTLLNVVNFGTYVSVALLLVVGEQMGVRGIVYANLFSSVVMLAFCIVLLQSRARRPFQARMAHRLLNFGLPLLPGGLALWALALLDRWLLVVLSPDAQVGISAAGIYDVAYRFGMVVSFLLVVPLRTAWVPTLYTIRDHPDAPRLYGRLLTLTAALGSTLALALAVLAPEIIAVTVGADFQGAAGPLPLIAFAYLAYGLSQVADAGILARGRTAVYPLVTATSVAVNISLCVLLIPRWGIMGAAWATLIAYLWHALLIGRVSHSISPIRMEWGRLAVIAAAAAVVGGLAYGLPRLPAAGDLSPGAVVALKGAVLALYPLLLWRSGLMRPTDRKDRA